MHTIEPTEKTTHGYFSRDLEPILTIQPGETVRYRTLDSRWNAYNPETDALEKSPLREPDPLKGHAMCGPIAIEGAKKGMTLEIEIGEIITAPLGWNEGGGADRPLWRRLGVTEPPLHVVQWRLDNDARTATSSGGFRTRLAPFMGVLGMPPDEPGLHTTRPPRIYGGNIDTKLLHPGSKLYLPIAVDGGLFSTGDGHAAQGDGEVSITAIECPIDRVDLTFRLHDRQLNTPRAENAEGWITLGFDADLDEAMLSALNAMLDFMMEHFGISRKEALALASVVVDLRVTQIVNEVQGVQAVLPYDALERV